MGVAEDGVGLEMNNARFKNFTKADYDKIYNMLAANQDGITSSIIKDMDIKAADLPCEYVIAE